MNQEKIDFLKNDFIFLLKHLAPDARGAWGVLNGQQMVEHFADVVMHASGKLKLPPTNEGEALEKSRSFLMSDKPFQQNIKNPFMNETPPAPRKATMQASIEKLQKELTDFFKVFEMDPDLKTSNTFFGELDFNGNVQLLHKHAMHHLKQFGLVR